MLNSELGKCYVKCLIVDEYSEIIECVMVKVVFKKIIVVLVKFVVV